MGIATRTSLSGICSDSILHYGNCRIGSYFIFINTLSSCGPQLFVWRVYRFKMKCIVSDCPRKSQRKLCISASLLFPISKAFKAQYLKTTKFPRFILVSSSTIAQPSPNHRPCHQSNRNKSQSTPSWHSRIITMIRSIDTQPTASERVPEDTLVRSGEAVSVGLDDGIAGGQDCDINRQQ